MNGWTNGAVEYVPAGTGHPLKSLAHNASGDVPVDWVDRTLGLEPGVGAGDCVGDGLAAVCDGDVVVAPQPIARATLAASAMIRAAGP